MAFVPRSEKKGNLLLGNLLFNVSSPYQISEILARGEDLRYTTLIYENRGYFISSSTVS